MNMSSLLRNASNFPLWKSGECHFAAQPGSNEFLRLKNNRGFTLVELIMVMVIVGIMAAVAAPKFFDNTAYQNRGAADQVKAALRYGQKVAIAERSNVRVDISTAANPACNITVTLYVVSCTISTAVSLSQTLPSSVTFNGLGQPFSNVTTPLVAPGNTITVGGTTITIEQETGYVH